MVKYEDLVLHPRSTLHTIVNFVGVEWHDWLMEHEKHMDMIGLSGVEKSTDQVKKPLYTDSLTAWVGQIPADVEKDLRTIAPMIATLGYDIASANPSYGRPDAEVTEKYNDWVNKQQGKQHNAPIVHIRDNDDPQQQAHQNAMRQAKMQRHAQMQRQAQLQAKPKVKALP